MSLTLQLDAKFFLDRDLDVFLCGGKVSITRPVLAQSVINTQLWNWMETSNDRKQLENLNQVSAETLV